MAFHLHRLGLVGRALREVGYNMHDAADLAAGRMSLKSADTTELAERLGIAEQQLTRSPTNEEGRAWAFYRRAAANPSYVWNSARTAWRAANCSDRQAAGIMGLKKSNVSTAVSSTATRRVLTFHQAARLTTALNIIDGPESFLPLSNNSDPQHSR